MATRTTTTVVSNASDANFRALGSWLSGNFSTFGWTATYSAFTSGTNWSDVTAPTVANTARVTEVWACADTAQSTTPYYVKVEYGCGSTTTQFALRISVGTGHAGSGVLSGILFDSGASYFNATANTNAMNHYASGDTGRICFAFGVAGTSWADGNMGIFNFERRKNGSGVDQTTGAMVAFRVGSNSRHTGLLPASAPPNVGTGAFKSAAYFVSGNTDQTFDSKMQISPVLYLLGPMEMGLGMVVVPTSAYSPGGTFSVTILGASHTYVCTQGTSPGAGISGTFNLAIRYE